MGIAAARSEGSTNYGAFCETGVISQDPDTNVSRETFLIQENETRMAEEK